MAVVLQQLAAWLRQPEDEHLEFKEAKQRFDFELLVRYCAALANEGGGRIVLGVSDKQPRRVVGSSAFPHLERTKAGLVERLHLRIDIDALAHDEGRVVVVSVPSRPMGMPIQYKGAYWMRSGEALVPMTPDHLKAIFAESEPDFSAEVCPTVTLDDLHPDAITKLREMWSATSGNAALLELSTEQLLTDAELLVDGGVTYAALILLGAPQALSRHVAQSEVIFEYRSHSANVTHQQRKEYREAFLLYHDNLWETIHLRNDLSTYQERFVRRKIHAFNETAVREAILNAVSHREYRHQGSVFVRQWPRRIEITSPGGFPQGVTPETMLWKQSPRNRRIAESFARCGLVERAGQGANLIFETCIRESKLPPSFKGSDAFQVCMTLDGEVRDTLFVRFLNRAVAEAGRLDADDLLVLDHVHRGLEIPERAGERIVALCERDILEQDGDGFRLSHRMWDRAELNGASPEPRVLVWESPNGTNLDTAPATSGKGSGETWVRAGFLELLNVLETGLGESSLEPELATELLEDARKVRRQVEGDRPNGALVLGKVRTIVDVLGESTSGGELVLVARRLLDRGSELFGD